MNEISFQNDLSKATAPAVRAAWLAAADELKTADTLRVVLKRCGSDHVKDMWEKAPATAKTEKNLKLALESSRYHLNPVDFWKPAKGTGAQTEGVLRHILKPMRYGADDIWQNTDKHLKTASNAILALNAGAAPMQVIESSEPSEAVAVLAFDKCKLADRQHLLRALEKRPELAEVASKLTRLAIKTAENLEVVSALWNQASVATKYDFAQQDLSPNFKAFSDTERYALADVLVNQGQHPSKAVKVPSVLRTHVERVGRGWRNICMQPYADPNLRWGLFLAAAEGKEFSPYTAKECPNGLQKIVPQHGFNLDTYKELCKLAEIDPVSSKGSEHYADRYSAGNLTCMFGKDVDAAKSFVEGFGRPRPSFRLKMHDAGLFEQPQKGCDLQGWKSLVLRTTEIPEGTEGPLGYAGRWKDLEQIGDGGVPKSLKELTARATLLNYGASAADNKELADWASKQGLSPRGFAYAKHLLPLHKKTSNIPNIQIVGDTVHHTCASLVLKLIPPNDLRALTIGKESGCCQHVDGAGASFAAQTFTSPNYGVYVIENPATGTVLAQTGVWMAGTGAGKQIVLDSIESRFSDPESVIKATAMIHALCAELKQKGYSSFVSTTDYGMTKDITSQLGLGKSDSVATPQPKEASNYTDCGATVLSTARCLQRSAPESHLSR